MSEVATEILRQLGGRMFIMMTGAKDLVGDHDRLIMKVKGISATSGQRCTHVRIILDPSDTYTVEFLRWNGRAMEYIEVSKHEGIYCDGLKDLFEEETCLYVTLNARAA